MKDINVSIKKLKKNAIVPTYSTTGSVCCDLYAYGDYVIPTGKTILVDTGIAIKLPDGFEAQIRPRSGLAGKKGITVLNGPGSIDEDYTGPIKVILINLGEKSFSIKHGDRIAQIAFCPYYKAKFVETDELELTERGDNGFGSTGL